MEIIISEQDTSNRILKFPRLMRTTNTQIVVLILGPTNEKNQEGIHLFRGIASYSSGSVKYHEDFQIKNLEDFNGTLQLKND